MPSQSNYSRFFGRFPQWLNTEIFPELQHWFFEQLNIVSLTVDFDSTVITHYWDQQGSAKGYNPNKWGRNSHDPLMAFVEQTRMVANAWLRPGDAAASSSCKEFMEETFKQVLKDKKIGLENFCLQDFWATEASFRFIMVAYNLMSLFRHFALNHHNRATLGTLRSYCFALGAWTVSHANKKVLKISLPTKRRPWMDTIFSQISNLSNPYSYSNA
jgi:hypothetical protein